MDYIKRAKEFLLADSATKATSSPSSPSSSTPWMTTWLKHINITQVRYVFYILSLIVIVIMCRYIWIYRKTCENSLEGWWFADKAYLEQNTNDVRWYFSPIEDGIRKGYLLVVDPDGNALSNSSMKVVFDKLTTSAKGEITCCAKISETIDQEFEIPELLNIVADITGKSISISDASTGKVLFTGCRDNFTSIDSQNELDVSIGIDEESDEI